MANHRSLKEIPPVVIRRSVVLFVIRVILLELLFEILYLVWRGLIHFLPLPVETIITLNAFSLVLFLILITVIQNIFLIGIVLNWVNDYYEIRSDEIAHIHGTFSKTEKILSVSRYSVNNYSSGIFWESL